MFHTSIQVTIPILWRGAAGRVTAPLTPMRPECAAAATRNHHGNGERAFRQIARGICLTFRSCLETEWIHRRGWSAPMIQLLAAVRDTTAPRKRITAFSLTGLAAHPLPLLRLREYWHWCRRRQAADWASRQKNSTIFTTGQMGPRSFRM